MPSFRYVATDSEGNRISGELQADTQEQAVTQLESSGLFPITIEAQSQVPQASPVSQNGVWLSSSDLNQVTSKLRDLTNAGLPLVTGLRALGEEVPSRRLRRVFTSLSNRLGKGESLDTVLGQRRSNIPDHLLGLIRAGLISNNLGTIIEQYLKYTRDSNEIRRRVLLSMVYPLILVGLSLAFFVAFLSLIIPQFETLFEDFQIELPVLTTFLIELSQLVRGYWHSILLGIVVVVILAWSFSEFTAGKAMRRRFIGSIPIFGPLSRYASLSQFCHLLGIMIDNRIRLPDALRMVGMAVKDANVREGCLLLAQDVEDGHSLNDAGMDRPHFPSTLTNTFRWQEYGDAFPDALHASAEIYSAMAKTQSGLVRVVCEPLLIISVAGMVGFAVLGLFLPLIQLLSDLS